MLDTKLDRSSYRFVEDALRRVWLSYGPGAVAREFGAEGARALYMEEAMRREGRSGVAPSGAASFGALIPPDKAWMIGRTPEEISAVSRVGVSGQIIGPMWSSAGATAGSGAADVVLVGKPAPAATDLTPTKMSPATIRQRLSVADETGHPKVPGAAKGTLTTGPRSGGVGLSPLVRPTTRRVSLARPSAYDVDELLSRCPSSETMAAIRRDFNISFDARLLPDSSWSCSADGRESSAMLTVYNAFRAMRLIEFDATMPVLGTTNLYEWLFSLDLANIHFTFGEQWSHAERGSLKLRGELLDASELRVWVDPRSAIGLMNVVLLIVHEARHANAMGSPNANPDGTIGHVCSRDPSIENIHDPSIAYGGAWAAQYWTARWFAEHSGHYLTALEKRYAAGDAEQIRMTRFCNGGVQ